MRSVINRRKVGVNVDQNNRWSRSEICFLGVNCEVWVLRANYLLGAIIEMERKGLVRD